MTNFLFSWMYRKADGYPFGCKVQAIHFTTPGAEEIKGKLIEYIQSLLTH